MSEPIIQIEHLNKTFGAGPTAVHALEDINLAVQPGEIFGIIGLFFLGRVESGKYTAGIVAVFALETYTTAAWWCWCCGSVIFRRPSP